MSDKITVYQQIVNEGKEKKFDRQEEAIKWFRETASKIAKAKTPPTFVIRERKQIPEINANKFIGSLFLYNYSPKLKKELPYYDTFPVVFPFRILDDGFLGINLHYLPINYRADLMDMLYGLTNSKDLQKDSTRLAKLTYLALESKVKNKYYVPCIKRYLTKHIRGKPAFIPPSEWEVALFLPMQRFQKETQATVWKESVQKIRKAQRKGP